MKPYNARKNRKDYITCPWGCCPIQRWVHTKEFTRRSKKAARQEAKKEIRKHVE